MRQGKQGMLGTGVPSHTHLPGPGGEPTQARGEDTKG